MCDVSKWCAYNYENNNFNICETCNCNTGESCEVSQGAESLDECEIFAHLHHSLIHTSYPENIEDTFSDLEASYYDCEC